MKRLFIAFMLLNVCSPAFSSSIDESRIWLTVEVKVYPDKVSHPPQASLFYGNKSACEKSLRGFFNFYPEGKIKQSSISKSLRFEMDYGVSKVVVNCIDRLVGEEIKDEFRKRGRLIE